MPYLPVYLRNIIIDPTIARPKQYICIQIVIVLQAVGLASERIVLFVTVDTKRTNTELHPRLQATNSLVYLLNQYINIAPAPVGTIGEPSAVTGKACVIRKVHAFCRIRIEIIIHMNSVYIVTRNNVRHHHANMTTTFGQCRIKKELIIVSDKPFRMDIIQVIGRQLTLQ